MPAPIDYDARFLHLASDMKRLVEAAALPFGAEVFAIDGDERGFGFAVARDDGTLSVALQLVEAETADGRRLGTAGNVVLRFDDGETASSWGPDNRTEECWAYYGDDDAWERKMADVRDQFVGVPEAIEAWRSPAGASPGA